MGPCLTRYTPETVPERENWPESDVKRETEFYLTKVRNYTSCYQKAPLAYTFDNLRTADDHSVS